MERISSRQNPRVGTLARLLREKSERKALGCFVIEGCRECLRALEAGIRPLEYYVAPDLFCGAPPEKALLARWETSGALGFELSREAFEKASGREGPDGFLMTAPRLDASLSALKDLPSSPLFLVLESVEKPGNLGALLRTADAAGVSAVICCNGGIDIHNPNVVRNSQGALFSVPVACATNEETAEFLAAHKAVFVYATPGADTVFWDAPLAGPTAVFMGSEKDGLTDFWLQRPGVPVRIPMAGGADSLNVSVAAALVLFEAVRQRRA